MEELVEKIVQWGIHPEELNHHGSIPSQRRGRRRIHHGSIPSQRRGRRRIREDGGGEVRQGGHRVQLNSSLKGAGQLTQL